VPVLKRTLLVGANAGSNRSMTLRRNELRLWGGAALQPVWLLPAG